MSLHCEEEKQLRKALVCVAFLENISPKELTSGTQECQDDRL